MLTDIQVKECHRRTKLLIRIGHAFINGILDVLDIVLNGDVLIIGCVVVGHYDDKVISSKMLEEEDEQNVIFICLQLKSILLSNFFWRNMPIFIHLFPSLNVIPVHHITHPFDDERDRQETSPSASQQSDLAPKPYRGEGFDRRSKGIKIGRIISHRSSLLPASGPPGYVTLTTNEPPTLLGWKGPKSRDLDYC
jgi:hypothetical protein